jgi:hypothetical protein
MAKLAAAALSVTRDELRTYDPRRIDIEIAQALLEGAISVPEIAENIGKGTETVRKVCKDPVAFAWICDKISQLIHTRIGLVDAALLRRATQGDVRAMDLYFKRFGKLADIKIIAHGSLGDLSQYSDSDLDATIASEIKQNPNLLESSPPQSSTVIDVTPEETPS